jgi:predicted neuraminidase
VILLTTSGDGGETWSVPVVMANLPGTTRAYDPCLWHDPVGRLWLIYNHADLEKRECSVWARAAENAEAADAVWGAPRELSIDAPFVVRLNKPLALESGDWMMPVTWGPTAPGDSWFAGGAELQGVAISSDKGTSWTLHGAVGAPGWALENMIVELRDGRLWMLIRSGGGTIWQSFSEDGGVTWSAGSPTTIVNPGSRFFVRRLTSGHLLLINSPEQDARRGLIASLSDPDDEMTFVGRLELDDREPVSYPDAVQSSDGRIFAVHDWDRGGAGEIRLSVFSDEEIV